MYFEKLRSLATGIAVCGSGFGTVVFAPLTNYLITEYKWQGACLVIAGIVFFCAIFGYMFKPLDLDAFETVKEHQPTPSISGSNNNNNNNNVKQHVSEHDLTKTSLLTQQQISRSQSIGIDMSKNGGSTKNYSKSVDENSRLALSVSQPLLNDSEGLTQRPIRTSGSGTLDRPDAFYTGSTHNLAKHRSHGSIHSLPDRYGSLKQRVDNREVDETNQICGCIPCSQETRDTMTKMMSFSLLKDPVFILFTVSNFLTR